MFRQRYLSAERIGRSFIYRSMRVALRTQIIMSLATAGRRVNELSSTHTPLNGASEPPINRPPAGCYRVQLMRGGQVSAATD
jgi:hypothetical protein